MKKILNAFVFIIAIFVAQAQDKITTKIYINNKLRDSYGNIVTDQNGRQRLLTSTFDKSFNNIEKFETAFYYEGEYGMNVDSSVTYTLDPKYIINVEEFSEKVKESSIIGFIKITFSSKSVVARIYYDFNTQKTINTDVVFFPYLKNKPEEFSRIKKAILHLAELSKEEKDPFDN